MRDTCIEEDAPIPVGAHPSARSPVETVGIYKVPKLDTPGSRRIFRVKTWETPFLYLL